MAAEGEKVITTADSSLDGSLDPAAFALQSWNTFAKLCSIPLMSYDEAGNELMEAAESWLKRRGFTYGAQLVAA